MKLYIKTIRRQGSGMLAGMGFAAGALFRKMAKIANQQVMISAITDPLHLSL